MRPALSDDLWTLWTTVLAASIPLLMTGLLACGMVSHKCVRMSQALMNNFAESLSETSCVGIDLGLELLLVPLDHVNSSCLGAILAEWMRE